MFESIYFHTNFSIKKSDYCSFPKKVILFNASINTNGSYVEENMYLTNLECLLHALRICYTDIMNNGYSKVNAMVSRNSLLLCMKLVFNRTSII